MHRVSNRRWHIDRPAHRVMRIAALLVILALSALPVAPARAEPSDDVQGANEPVTPQPSTLYLPQVALGVPSSAWDETSGCPTASTARYAAAPVLGPPTDRPPAVHADLNLAVRGYVTITAPLALVEINGDTDWDPPQLATLFAGRSRPELAGAFQVRSWDWGCVDHQSAPWYGHGCRAGALADPPVTLLALSSTRGEPIRVPSRRAEVYPGMTALVLYADETRLTLGYTLEDTAAHGYVAHIEDICVDANLLALYRSLDAAGRASLPGLRNGDAVGVASAPTVKVAVRDCGSFMDPRSRKDWWQID